MKVYPRNGYPASHYEPVLSVFPNGAFLQEQSESSTVVIVD